MAAAQRARRQAGLGLRPVQRLARRRRLARQSRHYHGPARPDRLRVHRGRLVLFLLLLEIRYRIGPR